MVDAAAASNLQGGATKGLADASAVWLPPSELARWNRNPRRNDRAVPKVARSLARFGFVAPVCVWREADRMVAGHTRLAAAEQLFAENPSLVLKGAPGPGLVRVVFHSFASEAEADAYAIADNRLAEIAEWDGEKLADVERSIAAEDAELLRVAQGLDAEILQATEQLAQDEQREQQERETREREAKQQEQRQAAVRTLAERFGVPPFSVLDARQGYWQERKRAWLSLGLKSEEGRGTNLLGRSLQELVAISYGGATGKSYDAVVKFIAEQREKGLTDEQIKLEALARVGNKTEGAVSANVELEIPGYYEKLNAGQTRDEIIAEWQKANGGAETITGTSIFDPVLCELLYRWFSPPSGTVLDPFAGGSVRGVVAATLGRSYRGFELRAEQVEANRKQWAELSAKQSGASGDVTWTQGDSAETIAQTPAEPWADFVFSCPPYADLEVYSDDPQDLSTMEYPAFREAYAKIIADACARLKADRFAAFVIGEVRKKGDKVGGYLGFVQDTIAAFEAAGLTYYNEAILVTATGTLPLRVSRFFSSTRKLGKTHQNVLVFVKGDPRKAIEAIGDSEFGEGEAAQLGAAPAAAAAPASAPSAGVTELSLGGEV